MTSATPLALSLAVSAAILSFSSYLYTGDHKGNSNDSLYNREARGDITEYAGARRLDSDLTKALKK
jgi:alkaline phosphatase